jgi:hypothetical protein
MLINFESEEDIYMLDKEFGWFFIMFGKEFRRGDIEAFRTLMFLSLAHFFGLYNPKEFADYLNISSQRLYEHLKGFSLYYIKEMLIRFMVMQAAGHLKPALEKSDATRSRAGITLAVDNSVIDRLGRIIRCTYSWYSGRWKKVVNGNDLLGIVLTVNGFVFPLHLLFCSKQGRAHTDKPSLLISMLTRLKEEFAKQDIDITQVPLTLDSWFVSEELRQKLHELGFGRIVIAGKGNYTFKIGRKKQKASVWKKEIILLTGQWGTEELPCCRVKAESPAFGDIVLFFFEKSKTKTYYLMDFSVSPMRGAEIWHIWKQHHLIEYFWKILKSVFKIKSMQLQGDGLYAALLIKVISYLLAMRLKSTKAFSKFSVMQIMRKIRREYDLGTFINEHFHQTNSTT